MRAITLHEPWASAVAWGLKTWETRTWKIAPGLLAIHASALRSNRDHRDFYYEQVCALARGRRITPPIWASLPFGAVVATCRVARCLPAEEARYLVDRAAPSAVLGDFSAGRWAWELVDLVRLARPSLARGHQGLWDWR